MPVSIITYNYIIIIKCRLTRCTRGEYFVFQSSGQPPMVIPRLWQKQKFDYDNVASAMLTLFAVQTTEGWPA